jgi:hypothetical protein
MDALKKSKNRVGDMTVAELREVIRETVSELLLDLSQADDGLEFTPEVAKYLEAFRAGHPRGTPMEEVFKEMGVHD